MPERTPLPGTMRPLVRRTTSEALAGELRSGIQRGEFSPGERLRQAQIADRFGVSTTPVREAFALLQAEGLLRVDPHRGAFVLSPDADDVAEYYEIRGVLEDLAVSHGVRRMTTSLLDDLASACDAMEGMDDPAPWVRLNNGFHLRLYEGAGRPRLSAIISTLRDASSAYVEMCVAAGSRRTGANNEHRRILEACRSGDADAARAATREHLRRTLEAIVTSIGDRSESDRLHDEVAALASTEPTRIAP
jgi:DNA-binding GntR family transcriptional regulator